MGHHPGRGRLNMSLIPAAIPATAALLHADRKSWFLLS
jgi:hypothetical protein